MLPSARARPRAKSESKYIILKIYYYCYYAREARFINRDVVLDFCYETWLCYMIDAALFFLLEFPNENDLLCLTETERKCDL